MIYELLKTRIREKEKSNVGDNFATNSNVGVGNVLPSFNGLLEFYGATLQL